MSPERRQFERFEMVENAIAVDHSGRTLGRVMSASGGGMAIRLDDSSPSLTPGERLRVTIVESGPGARHTIDVVVRYRHKHSVGLEFVTGDST